MRVKGEKGKVMLVIPVLSSSARLAKRQNRFWVLAPIVARKAGEVRVCECVPPPDHWLAFVIDDFFSAEVGRPQLVDVTVEFIHRECDRHGN
jgi:hypothetical protein